MLKRWQSITISVNSRWWSNTPFSNATIFYQNPLIVNTSNFVCELIIASPSIHKTNCYLKWAWSLHMIHFKFQGPKHTSGITEARSVKFKFLTQVGFI